MTNPYTDITKKQSKSTKERKIPLANDTDIYDDIDNDEIQLTNTDNSSISKELKPKKKQVTVTIDVGTIELKRYWIAQARAEGETVSGLFRRYMLKKYGRPR